MNITLVLSLLIITTLTVTVGLAVGAAGAYRKLELCESEDSRTIPT